MSTIQKVLMPNTKNAAYHKQQVWISGKDFPLSYTWQLVALNCPERTCQKFFNWQERDLAIEQSMCIMLVNHPRN